MSGHVRKRGSKWYYSFEAGSIDGKRKRIERVGGKTKKEAEKALRIALQEYENAGSTFQPSSFTVSDYMDYWLKNYVEINCKYNTYVNYKRIIEGHIKPQLGLYKIKALTPSILQEFINKKYLTGISKNHLSNIMNVLKGSIKYSVFPCEFIKSDPTTYLKLPKFDDSRLNTDKKILSKADYQQILDRFPQGSSFYIPIIIGYNTGCRIGEVMGLTWDDINLAKGEISINKLIYKRDKNWYLGSPKTISSKRIVKIGNTLIKILKEHKKWQMECRLKYGKYYISQYILEDYSGVEPLERILSIDNTTGIDYPNNKQFICTKENGALVTTESFKYASRVIHYELGIAFNFHSLRHTHATLLIENGANIKDVQLRLGHSDIKTTLNTYTHATEQMAQQTVDLFEKVINSGKK